MSELSSVERKRIRDRRAQQTLRDKKSRHTAQLEKHLAYCEQYHNDKGVQQLLDSIKQLRKQNKTLLTRQKALKTLIASWDETEDMLPSDLDCWAYRIDAHNPIISDNSIPASQIRVANTVDESTSSTSPLPKLQSNTNLPWNQLPLYSDDFSNIETVSCFWFSHSDSIIASPESPTPLDILYGSKTNPLANMIHSALSRRPIRDPEQLAIGWLVYHFTKWVFAPSPKSYSLLPVFLRPCLEQLQVVHPLIIGLVCWPRIRLNLIRMWQMYNTNRDELFGLFSCCVKLRWPWGEKILERNEDNEIIIREEFYDVFMREEGWGVTKEFFNRFPELMEGIDVDSFVATIA